MGSTGLVLALLTRCTYGTSAPGSRRRCRIRAARPRSARSSIERQESCSLEFDKCPLHVVASPIGGNGGDLADRHDHLVDRGAPVTQLPECCGGLVKGEHYLAVGVTYDHATAPLLDSGAGQLARTDPPVGRVLSHGPQPSLLLDSSVS